MQLQGKTVLVVGAGRSGMDASRFLLAHGAKVILSDSKPREKLSHDLWLLEDMGVKLILVNQLPERITWDLVIVSPGVPPMIPLLTMSRAAGVEVIGEMELAYRFAKTPILAVTGTNGKTTTTALLGYILQHAGLSVLVGGNIGTPLVSSVEEYNGDYIVAEVSSFQLESCSEFKPHVGVHLNLTPDHLDRHGDMATYAAAKEKLFARMDASDFAILNDDDAAVKAIAGRCAAQPRFFSLLQPLEDGMYFDGLEICVMSKGKQVHSFPKSSIYIKGRHNMQNAMAAALAAQSVGVPYALIGEALAEFPGVEHRLEFVCERRGVTYINDSKGTNPASTYQALSAYDGPIVLMLGGYNKGSDFSPLFGLIQEKVKRLIIYGESLPLIKAAADAAGYRDYEIADNFRDAVTRAELAAEAGDVVLFSPACASWDEFDNFEQRGRLFKELIRG